MELVSSNLNSSDTFLLLSSVGSWVWQGQGSVPEEAEGANQVAALLGCSASIVSEGDESGKFLLPSTRSFYGGYLNDVVAVVMCFVNVRVCVCVCH